MIYMDNSATSPVNPEVFKEMEPFLKDEFGNASTLYSLGRESKKALDLARKRVANLINAEPKEIKFTSGGTESDNWAIKGIAFQKRNEGKHIITSIIEHPAVKNTCAWLEKLGYEITYLPVKENGIISIEDLKKAIREDTILISIMHANNEIGTIQPIEEIGKIAKEHNIIFHVDAVQSVGKIPVDVKAANIDLLSISSHKIYGPKGVGALYIRKSVKPEVLIHGGGQENNQRSGTENIPGIAGFGKACQLAYDNMEENSKKLIEIRDKIIDGVLSQVEESYLNGDSVKRLPNNINFRFSAIEGESLVLMLDAKGIEASTGSACSSQSLEPSYVLTSLGLDPVNVHGSLRLSLGIENTLDDADKVINDIISVVNTLRQMSPLWNSKKGQSDLSVAGDEEYGLSH
jgi:cysteine desulfurase